MKSIEINNAPHRPVVVNYDYIDQSDEAQGIQIISVVTSDGEDITKFIEEFDGVWDLTQEVENLLEGMEV